MAVTNHDHDVINEQILMCLKAEQKSDERYLGLCPAHDDHNPSLSIYLNAGGYFGFSCLSSKKCTHAAVIKAIKTKFGLDVPQRKVTTSEDKVQSAKVLYPAHESQLSFTLSKPGQILYEYYTELGEVAFIVQRYMEDDKKQTPAWFSVEYISEGGQSVKQWTSKNPPKSGRPLYSLDVLSANAIQKVLVVEGEKTAEAAKLIPQLADFVITTWSGGAKHLKASNWLSLKDRMSEIYFWPDHDQEGIKAMKEAAALVTTGPDDQRLYMLTYDDLVSHGSRISKGWDLADGCGNLECDFPFEELFDTFRPYYSEKSVVVEDLEDALALKDQRYRKLKLGGETIIVDLTRTSESSPFGLTWFKNAHDLAGYDVEEATLDGERPKQINVAERWCETRGENSNVFLYGVAFDPTTTDKEIVRHGERRLNTFNGLPILNAKNKNNKLLDIWLKHLEGMIPDTKTREWIIDYFADIFQHPGKKPGTALVLLGGQGVGKSILIKAVSNILGPMSKLIGKDIDKNNVALSRSLLVVHDEWSVHPARDKTYYEALKNAITNDIVRINEKYVPIFEADSFCRFAFTSNDSKPIGIPPDDRRFTIVRCDRTWHGNKEHFNTFFGLLKDDGALVGLRDYLVTKKIVSDLYTSHNTLQKEELYETGIRILDEVMMWANGHGLPGYFHETLGIGARDFGDHHVLIPKTIMKEYFRTSGIDRFYGNSDAALLNRIMPGPKFKRGIEVMDKQGGISKEPGLCFEIPKLETLRKNIEKELGRVYPWTNLEIKLDPNEQLDPETNVVPLKKPPL